MRHRGASMSQEGAQELALSGLTYNQILGRYTREASLARLSRCQGLSASGRRPWSASDQLAARAVLVP